MTDTIVVVSKVLPVIFMIVLGSILRRTGFLKPDTVNELKKIVVNIALPALLFMAFAETAFEARYILIFLAVFLTCGIMLLAGIAFRKSTGSGNRYVPSVFSGFETGMMGYSIFVAVYGAANMYKLAVIDLGQVTFVFFILVSYLQKLNGKSADVKQLTLSFIKSPVILSIITGMLAGALGIIGAVKVFPVSNSVLETLKLLSNITVPVICIVIGYELQLDVKNIGRPFLAAFTRLAVLMAIAFVINTFLMDMVLHLDNTFKIALYTMFLLPPPFVIPIFMEDREGKDRQFILNTISISILLSLAAFLVLIVVMH
jgi:hypothetical protein